MKRKNIPINPEQSENITAHVRRYEKSCGLIKRGPDGWVTLGGLRLLEDVWLKADSSPLTRST